MKQNTTTAIVTDLHPDADLTRYAATFEVLWNAEGGANLPDAEADKIGDARRAIEDLIAKTPATTLAGLAAKAAVCAKYERDVEIVAVRNLIDEVQRLSGQAASPDALSPHLAELKVQFDQAAAKEAELHQLPPEAYEDVWQVAWREMMDIALKVMGQTVHTPADFRFKHQVWIRASGVDEGERDDDMSTDTGWLERAPHRLINDARSLAGQVA